MTRTIVALYDNFSTAQEVVEELVEAGFARENMSLVANDASGTYREYVETDWDDEDVSAGEGAGFGAVVGTLVGLGVALIPGVGPVLAAGPLAAALMAGIGAAAGAATGGVVASLVDFGIPETEAHVYAEGLRRGGTMVSAMVDDATANRAEEIMNRHNPIDLDYRATAWRESGWAGYSPDAEPYTTDMIETERTAYTNPTTTRDPANMSDEEFFREYGHTRGSTGSARVYTRND